VYNRTAFQVAHDPSIRVSLDTDLTFIREDGPSRHGSNWRREDVGVTWPFDYLDKGDVESFPFAIFEIKIKAGTPEPEWITKIIGGNGLVSSFNVLLLQLYHTNALVNFMF
jgi:hypothetical protein